MVLTRPTTHPSAPSGSRLPASALAQSSTRSNSGASAAQGGEAAGHVQPSAVPAAACCTATDRMLHHRRAHPEVAARRTAGGARYARARTRSCTGPKAPAFQRPPISVPSTMRRGGPPMASSRCFKIKPGGSYQKKCPTRLGWRLAWACEGASASLFVMLSSHPI